MLLQNGREVGLGHVVGKRAVAEHDGGVAGRRQLFAPGDHAVGQRLDLFAGYFFGQADDQRAGADVMHRLARERARFDRHAQIETKLQQQLVEHIVL